MLRLKKFVSENQEPTMLTRNGIPPESPPLDEPKPWTWQCIRYRRRYKISVIRRCLTCTTTPRTGFAPLHRSFTKPKTRRNSLKKRRVIPPTKNFDWDFWTGHKDWRRFRLAYEADPREWHRRNIRDLAGYKGAERRAKKWEVETQRRQEITEDRLERMLNVTWNCERDCDYPCQCLLERREWNLRTPQLVISTGKEGDTRKISGYRLGDKLPLCNLLPDFEDRVIIEAELGDEDETLEEDEAGGEEEDIEGDIQEGDEILETGEADEGREDTPIPDNFEEEEDMKERHIRNRRRLWVR